MDECRVEMDDSRFLKNPRNPEDDEAPCFRRTVDDPPSVMGPIVAPPTGHRAADHLSLPMMISCKKKVVPTKALTLLPTRRTILPTRQLALLATTAGGSRSAPSSFLHRLDLKKKKSMTTLRLLPRKAKSRRSMMQSTRLHMPLCRPLFPTSAQKTFVPMALELRRNNIKMISHTNLPL